MSTLSKKKQEVWDKLNYVSEPTHTFDLDVNSMYTLMSLPVFSITEIKAKEDGLVTIKVIKNR